MLQNSSPFLINDLHRYGDKVTVDVSVESSNVSKVSAEKWMFSPHET